MIHIESTNHVHHYEGSSCYQLYQGRAQWWSLGSFWIEQNVLDGIPLLKTHLLLILVYDLKIYNKVIYSDCYLKTFFSSNYIIDRLNVILCCTDRAKYIFLNTLSTIELVIIPIDAIRKAVDLTCDSCYRQSIDRLELFFYLVMKGPNIIIGHRFV